MAAGAFGFGDDGGDVEVALANFAEFGGGLCIDAIVLEVNDGEASGEAFAPCNGVAATVLDPVGVGLCLEVAGGGAVVEEFKDDAAVELLEFVMVVVVGEGDACGCECGAGGIEFGDESGDRFLAGEIKACRVGVGGEVGAHGAKGVNDLLGTFEDGVAIFVGGADGETVVCADAGNVCWWYGPVVHAADLHGTIADGSHFATAFSEVLGGFEMVAESVKLDGDLINGHGGVEGKIGRCCSLSDCLVWLACCGRVCGCAKRAPCRLDFSSNGCVSRQGVEGAKKCPEEFPADSLTVRVIPGKMTWHDSCLDDFSGELFAVGGADAAGDRMVEKKWIGTGQAGCGAQEPFG